MAAARTAGGRRGGRLSGWHPADLAAQVIDALLERTNADPALVDDVIMGCVLQAGEQSGCIGRMAVLASKLPKAVPGVTIDRQCGSSQQALHFAAQAVMAGTMDCVIAAGVESMSRIPMTISKIYKDAGLGHYMSPTIRARYIERIVNAVNRLGADMVAITGDLVDGSVAELSTHVAPLGRLKARHGTYVVTGNHEYYAGAHAWVDELRRLGLNVLMNEHVVLQTKNVSGAQTDEEVHESALVVAGVTDYTAGHFDHSHASDPEGAVRDAPPQVHTRVLLAHQPRSAIAAAQAGYQLQLSGHTHGGQFFPWNLFVPLQQPFTAGLHRLHDMWVYVSRGTGYWGPPKRFGAPSEITLLRLVQAG